MLSKWGRRFSPLSLFAAGEQGGWWDPSDFGTMFQDSAGTTPVTAVGQPVGLIRDKSGRGNHASQGTAASRPTLQQDASGYLCLSFDGVDDFLSTPVVTAAAGFAGLSVSATALAFQTPLGSGGQASAEPGVAVKLRVDGSVWASKADGVTTAQAKSSIGITSAGIPAVAGAEWSAANIVAHVNATAINNGTAANAATASAFFLGKANSAGTPEPFAGRVYASVVRSASSSATELSMLKRYLGSKAGLVL